MLFGPDQVIACPACGVYARVRTYSSGSNINSSQWTDGKLIMPMMPGRLTLTVCATCHTYYWLSGIRAVGEFYPDWRPIPTPPAPKAVVHRGSLLRKLRTALASIFPTAPAAKPEAQFPTAPAAKPEAQLEPPVVPEEWRAAPYIESLSEEQLLEAIEAGLATDEGQERFLRLEAFWRSNDWLVRDLPFDPLPDAEVRLRSEASVANMLLLFDLLDAQNPHEQILRGEIMRELGRFDEAEQILSAPFGDELAETVSFIRKLVSQRETDVRRIPKRI